MKIKKGLALILALAMIITLMPTMAFATTTNTVSKVVTVAAEDEMPATTINLETKDAWDADEAQTIRLTLNNATWTNNPANGDKNVITYADADGNDQPVLTVNNDTAATAKVELAVKFIVFSDNTLEFSMTPDEVLPKGTNITLEFANEAIKSGAEAGAVEIAIDGLDSQVSSSTTTIANVATSTTTANVTGTVKTFPIGDVAEIGTTIEIRETAINSLPADSTQTIRLTLPKGVTWNSSFDKNDIGGNLAGSIITVDNTINSDHRTVEIVFKVAADSNDVRNVMTITPDINISKDADEGDIAVSLIGVSGKDVNNDDVNMVTDADDLVIAAYGNESVEITTEEEVPTIVSGYTEDTKDKDFIVSITMEESMKDSLSSGRYVDFDLPEEVQICGPVEAKVNSGSMKDASGYVTVEGVNNNSAGSTYADYDTSGFEFEIPDNGKDVSTGNTWSGTKANKITFEIPVTVEAGFSGDITMNITGAKAGVEDTELVVAKAETPITVETTTTNVKNGIQTQVVADITITENFAGYIDDQKATNSTPARNILTLSMDTLGLSQSMVFGDCDSVEVTKGNLEIEKWEVVNGNDPCIEITIDRESTTASTIELKGLTMTLNRTLPEGGYDLKVGGGSVVQNSEYNDDHFSGTAATVEDYVVITTPAENAGINATFTAGQASYTLNGQTVTMDVAPYIDSNNRMLVPIRYAANAMGVSDSNIQWNGYTQTGTISGAMGVVQVTVGSTNLITSNGTITMDTVAVNSNDRIYVPVRYIANALGASVEWDPATRTATFS